MKQDTKPHPFIIKEKQYKQDMYQQQKPVCIPLVEQVERYKILKCCLYLSKEHHHFNISWLAQEKDDNEKLIFE